MLEAAVKRALKKRLQELGAYWFMPVQRGLGAATLDFLICHKGRFIGLESKAPGEKPTPRQRVVMAQMRAAGATVMVIDNVEDAKNLMLDH
jgi:hypothetical protein